MEEVFREAFVAGLHHPNSRPQPQRWLPHSCMRLTGSFPARRLRRSAGGTALSRCHRTTSPARAAINASGSRVPCRLCISCPMPALAIPKTMTKPLTITSIISWGGRDARSMSGTRLSASLPGTLTRSIRSRARHRPRLCIEVAVVSGSCVMRASQRWRCEPGWYRGLQWRQERPYHLPMARSSALAQPQPTIARRSYCTIWHKLVV